ncbi:ATP-binding protein [Sphingobium yanoikuyae]|jgi:two-component system, OmpR family, sensor histidine kinase QseC|uniref:histidine kinase n=2 Tax=Sphingobium TaxID=165695 RepID=A0AA42WXL7_SPHYA|nr:MULTISPECIES: ATP-binding protein [Sphingomonadales]MDH2132386.1 ATP-binding protein [Sphingobium yanoikuyae]MDH2152107.1 ATP-binding protein [Sphingobium yanoikuyae]MDH2167870.1 ATP-binding protein [Sphingobium yanoikuyae]MDV5822135.1 ATP-binding protein [Sphingobium naphthae]
MMSLRIRLFALVAAITMIVWAGAATWTALSTRAEVQRVLDGRLIEAARMVAALDVPMVDEPRRLPPTAYTRQLSCQIWSMGGELIGQSAGAPDLPLAQGQPGFSERQIGDQHWRVYTHVDAQRGLRVMVGDNLSVRQRLVTGMMIGLLLPALVGLAGLGVLLWLGVGRGLRPLDALARSIAARSPSSLTPLDETVGPSELRHVVQEMNGLLRRLEAARQAERDFVANAAHEMQTPLAGLKTQAEVARRATDPAMRDHALEQITRSVNRTSRMVRQLLSLAGEEGRAREPQIQPVVLDPVLAEVIDDYRAVATARDMRIVVAPSCEGAAAPMAPEALRQAIGNLVENALHHAGPGGEVVIACETNGKAMEILVMDRGSGIAPQDRDRLRRRFERGAGVQNSGSGLGLSIVEAAVESCGARLDLRERPSGGLIAAIRFDRSI